MPKNITLATFVTESSWRCPRGQRVHDGITFCKEIKVRNSDSSQVAPEMTFNLCLYTSLFFTSAAARLYPTRQGSGQEAQAGGGGGGGAFSGGMSGGGGGGGGFSSRTGFLRRSNNSKTTKAAPTSTNAGGPNYQQQNANFANYQNCTIVRSHTPHGNYGYVKVAPKILIFPIFVQVSRFWTQPCYLFSTALCWLQLHMKCNTKEWC